MSQGSAWERLVRGTGWIWLSEQYRTALPANIAAAVMTLRSSDHYHAKQGRSTARVRFDTPHGTPLSVYLKRHEHLPWITRVAAFLNPSGRHSPAGAEWAHLECFRALGISVPDPWSPSVHLPRPPVHLVPGVSFIPPTGLRPGGHPSRRPGWRAWVRGCPEFR